MKFRLFLFLFPVSIFGTALAQDKPYQNEVGIQSDNDGFLATRSDRYYTAGNFFYFRHALKVNDNSNIMNRVLTFELGQKIYNPQSGALPGPAYIDRPFAGYLYAGANINLLYKNESSLKLQLRTGYVGPSAGGEEIQDLIHNTFGFYQPEGWEYQIKDAFQFNGSVEYSALLTRGETADLSFNSYGNLGTGIIGAGAGFMFRWGKFNQLYNSVSTTSTVNNNSKINPLHDSEFFFYYKPVLNVIAYDATIQGDIFATTYKDDEVTSKPNPVVFSQQVGGAYVKKHWVIDVSATFETREDQQMVRSHWGHQWGSISAMYRF